MENTFRIRDLKTVAEKLGISVEYGDFSKNEILAKSGFCKIKGQPVLLIDKKLDTTNQIEEFLKVLADQNLETIYVPDWIRNKLQIRERHHDLKE